MILTISPTNTNISHKKHTTFFSLIFLFQTFSPLKTQQIMGFISFIFSTKFIFSLLLFSAIPIGILITLERVPPSTHVYQYHSNSWLRECATWDDLNRRFIVSYMEGGVGEVKVYDDVNVNHGGIILDEITTVKDADLAGNASLGITIDRPRNRLLVVVSDLIGNRYSGLAAYDLSSWNRLFLTHLTQPGIYYALFARNTCFKL